MIAMENLETGKRKRPDGINILALMASLLDPRMKGGVGLSNEDKEIIYDKIQEAIIKIATMELKNAQPQEQAHQQPALKRAKGTKLKMIYLMKLTIHTLLTLLIA